MNGILRVALFIVIGSITMNLMAWASGNENLYTHKIDKEVSPLEVEDKLNGPIDPDKIYYYRTVVVETVKPSSVPLMYDRQIDTISISLKSKY